MFLELTRQTRITMASFFHQLLVRLVRFQNWFDQRFGWFFTNGMKTQDPDRDHDTVRA